MNLEDLSRVLFAFVAVIGFIGAAALIARKLGLAAGARALAKSRRLSIIESLPIDARRRAVIIRCDDREHLLLLGQSGETLIAADLPRPENAASPKAGAGASGVIASLADLSKGGAFSARRAADEADAA
jgi:flagellar protein FliO/FliZ